MIFDIDVPVRRTFLNMNIEYDITFDIGMPVRYGLSQVKSKIETVVFT